MLNTYIKNVGSTQTLIGNNHGAHIEEFDWNADYDGNQAKILVNTNSDGNRKIYHYTLDNADLADMLNINSVKKPLEMRLKKDFKKKQAFSCKPQYRIELAAPPVVPRAPAYLSEPSLSSNDSTSLIEMLQSSSPNSYLDSPASNEEFIVPIKLDQTSYTFTPKRQNLALKTHRTHRVFKRPKTTSSIRRRRVTSHRRPKSSRR
jgi:hypothetical protein